MFTSYQQHSITYISKKRVIKLYRYSQAIITTIYFFNFKRKTDYIIFNVDNYKFIYILEFFLEN